MKDKYLVHLCINNQNAVIIDFTPELARRRACLFDPKSNWENAKIEIITTVRGTRIERVLAIERNK